MPAEEVEVMYYRAMHDICTDIIGLMRIKNRNRKTLKQLDTAFAEERLVVFT